MYFCETKPDWDRCLTIVICFKTDAGSSVEHYAMPIGWDSILDDSVIVAGLMADVLEVSMNTTSTQPGGMKW